jgi:putative NIF3 family GTP cyclohydrolase 1 type 2
MVSNGCEKMSDPSVLLTDLAEFLGTAFAVDRYPATEQGGIYHPANRPVQRLGLVVEPFHGLGRWVADNQLDALWLHRPWKLDLASLPPDVGVLYNHLPFDEHLTMGYNPRLAHLLNATGSLEPLGFKQATRETGEPLPRRAIGMVFDAEPQPIVEWLSQLESSFGGYDRFEAGRQTTAGRIAVVGAMNDALIREAADRGAGLYITGQYRPSAQRAVDDAGIAVIALGHHRTEEWGVRALADMLREEWSGVECVTRTSCPL